MKFNIKPSKYFYGINFQISREHIYLSIYEGIPSYTTTRESWFYLFHGRIYKHHKISQIRDEYLLTWKLIDGPAW